MLRVLDQFESPSTTALNVRPAPGRAHRGFAVILLLLIVALPSPAIAHDGTGLAGGFATGFTHPLSGFDHMLAMVAVGIWGAFLGRPLVFALPMLFPSAMALDHHGPRQLAGRSDRAIGDDVDVGGTELKRGELVEYIRATVDIFVQLEQQDGERLVSDVQFQRRPKAAS